MPHNELAEQSAAYAQEIMRLLSINADLLAELEHVAQAWPDAHEVNPREIARWYVEILPRICAAIAKAHGRHQAGHLEPVAGYALRRAQSEG